jgi:hypothetical protein
MKKHRNKIIAIAFILCVLIGAWLWGGNYASRDDAIPTPPTEVSETGAADGIATETGDEGSGAESLSSEKRGASSPATDGNSAEMPPGEGAQVAEEFASETSASAEASSEELPSAESPGMVIDPETGKDKYLTDPVPEGKPIPVEPQNAVTGERTFTCTLSVRCDTIPDNMQLLNKEKHELVPADGVIFPATVVTFNEGESVFNVLQREMKRAGIHMEFENTPIYNSAYIEGINNLYEFDVGELSGWMYKVNGWYPNYGCSRYQVKDGDLIEWNYTCDLGRDLGEYWLGRDFFSE